MYALRIGYDAQNLYVNVCVCVCVYVCVFVCLCVYALLTGYDAKNSPAHEESWILRGIPQVSLLFFFEKKSNYSLANSVITLFFE